MRTINKIIVHCSMSSFGDVETIDRWHKRNGWNGIGYHYVITNGITHSGDDYNKDADGLLLVGRPVETVGAHCRGENENSIGICLIGNHHFSQKQFFALEKLIRGLTVRFNISQNAIYGHNEFNKRKTCPNFNVSVYGRK